MKENKTSKEKCSKCKVEFTCKSLEGNCWCNNYQLSSKQLTFLKENFDNCLCEKCLVQFAQTPSNIT